MAADDAPTWLPLESNPDVLNPFVRRLGLPDTWEFTDVFGLDEELLMMVPSPCAALCLLYPSPKISAPRRAALFAEKAAGKQHSDPPPGLFFLQQHDGIGNACGSIACMHAVANAAAAGAFALADGSPLAGFFERTAGMTVAQRGWELRKASDLQELSDDTAAAGETEGAGTDDAQDQHFIAFVPHGGALWELDGRTTDPADGAALPINHGPTTADSFLSDAAKVIREQFMARDPESIHFNVTALCMKQG